MISHSKYTSIKDLSIKMKHTLKNVDDYNNAIDSLVSLPLSVSGVTLMYSKEFVAPMLKYIVTLFSLCDFKNSYIKDSILLNSLWSATMDVANTDVDLVKSAMESGKPTRDTRLVSGLIEATNYAFMNPVNEDTYIKSWKIMSKSTGETSNYRDCMVYIGNYIKIIHVTVKPEEVNSCMDSLFGYLESKNSCLHDVLLKSIVAHFYVSYVHPYCRNNGVSARLLMQAYLNNYGNSNFSKLPIMQIMGKDIKGYHKSLNDSEYVLSIKGSHGIDITPFIVYCLNCLIESMKSFNCGILLSSLESKVINAVKYNQPNITVQGACVMFNVKEHTARAVLNGLRDKGLLKRYKSGVSSAYIYTLA